MTLRLSTLYTCAGGILRLAVGVISAPLLIRVLGVDQFGIWSVMSSVVALSLAFSEFGIATAVQNFLAADFARKDSEQANRTAATSLIITTALGLTVTLALVLAGDSLTAFLLGDEFFEEGKVALYFSAVTVAARLWQIWFSSVEASLARYDWQVAIEVPSALAIQTGSVVVALVYGTASAVAGWNLFVMAATCLAHVYAVWRIWPTSDAPFRFCTAKARELGSFGLVLWTNNVGYMIFSHADRILVDKTLGIHAAGLYSAAVSITNKIAELTAMFMRVLPTAVSAARATENQQRIRYLFGLAVKVNGVVTFAIASVLLFFAFPISTVLVKTPEAAGAVAQTLRILTLVYSLNSLCVTAGWFANGLGRPIILVRWSVPGSLLMCVLMQPLALAYGMNGAAWANAAYLLTAGITLDVARSLNIRGLSILRDFLPAIASLICCWALTTSSLYNASPVWIQLGFYIIVVPLLCLIIVTPRYFDELCVTSIPMLRSGFPWMAPVLDRILAGYMAIREPGFAIGRRLLGEGLFPAR